MSTFVLHVSVTTHFYKLFLFFHIEVINAIISFPIPSDPLLRKNLNNKHWNEYAWEIYIIWHKIIVVLYHEYDPFLINGRENSFREFSLW